MYTSAFLFSQRLGASLKSQPPNPALVLLRTDPHLKSPRAASQLANPHAASKGPRILGADKERMEMGQVHICSWWLCAETWVVFYMRVLIAAQVKNFWKEAPIYKTPKDYKWTESQFSLNKDKGIVVPPTVSLGSELI